MGLTEFKKLEEDRKKKDQQKTVTLPNGKTVVIPAPAGQSRYVAPTKISPPPAAPMSSVKSDSAVFGPAQNAKPSIRQSLTKPALKAVRTIIDVADIASGSVAFAPARTAEIVQGKPLGSSGVPLRFSEGAMEAAKASGLPKVVTAPVGIAAGVIGDPLNLIGGGAKGVAKIATELVPLARKAIKYKTADEFVRAAKELNVSEWGVDSEVLKSTVFKDIKPGSSADDVTRALTSFYEEAQKAAPRIQPSTPEDAAEVYWEEVLQRQIDEGNGITIGADDLKDYFGKDYDPANHKIYSKASYEHLFPRALKITQENDVVLIGGGPASAKTEGLINKLREAGFKGVIYDSNASVKEGVYKQIDDIRAAGKNPILVGVIPKVERSADFAFTRPREVGEDSFVRGHSGFPSVARAALDEGKLPPENVRLLDTRDITELAEVRARNFSTDPVALLKEVGYTDDYVRQTYRTAKERSELARKPGERQGTNPGDTEGVPGRGSGSGLDTLPPGVAGLPDDFPDTTEGLLAASQSVVDEVRLSGAKSPQEVKEKLEEAVTYTNIVKEVLDSHPAKSLTKFIGKTGDTGLEEKLATALYKGNTGESSKLDQIVPELGYNDLSEATAGLEEYLALRKEYTELRNTVAILRKEQSVNNKILLSEAEDENFFQFLDENGNVIDDVVRTPFVSKKASRMDEGLPTGPETNTPGSLPSDAQSGGNIPPRTGSPETPTSGTNPSRGPSALERIGASFGKAKTNILEYVQNTEERIRKLQQNPNLSIDDVSNVYQKMTLMPGRIAARVSKGYDFAEEISSDAISIAGRDRQSITAVRKEVSEYLQALHAPERNKALGDGAAGMFNEEAAEVIAKARPEVKALADKALDFHRETLEILRDAGVISDEFYTDLRIKYQNHVPLQRIMDEEDDIGAILTGRGYDVRSTGIKAAQGSDREVADVLTNIITNYEQAVIRAEKNIVDNATLAFVRKNKDALANVMTELKPKVIGTMEDGKPVFMKDNDPRVLHFFENGRPMAIKINDERLAIAYRGVGREKLGGIMNAVGAVTRLYSGLATRFNPEFALPNKLRDLQETITFLASQEDLTAKVAFKTAVRDPASTKAVFDAIRGADTPGAKLYREMQEMGGTTGGMGLSTRKQVEVNLDKIFETARSRPRKAAQKLIQYVDDWNTIFEDSTRLSVYKVAIEKGLSKERAAFLAKEASINFNRMGKGGPVLNALYMFANASVQGSVKMMRAMKNPKVAMGVVATVGASVAAVNEWNSQVDPKWRDKVTKWDRMNSLPIMLPSQDDKARYFTIPVSWGMKPIKVMADAAYDVYDGQGFDAKRVTEDVLSSFLNAYNPVGGTSLSSAMTPTIADLPNDIRANESWSGSKIRPDWDQNAPKDIQYFDSLEETSQGRAIIAATKEIRETAGISLSPANINYAIDQLVGGAGRSIRKTFNTIAGFFSEEGVPADEYPFVSRFYRERTAEETGNTATAGDAEILKALKSEQARESFYRRKEAEKTHQELKRLPSEEANARLKTLKQTNPLLADKVIQIAKDEKKGLTRIESSIQDLGVANGVRALYIYQELEKLETKEEKNAQFAEWKEKGLISDEVAKQIRALIKNPPKISEE